MKPNPLVVSTRVVDIATLIHHPRNARRGNLPEIAASLERFGQLGDVVVQQSTSYIIAGNHLTEAARDLLGWTKISAKFVDCDDATAEAYLLADNRLSDLAGYRPIDLAELMQAVAGRPLGLEGTGFKPIDLDRLVRRAGISSSNAADRIAIPPTHITEVGQTWRLGRHTLVVGDAHDPASWAGIPIKGSVVITDPPYGINLNTDFAEYLGPNTHGKGGKTYAPVIGDDRPYDPTPILEHVGDLREQAWFGADYYRGLLYPDEVGSWLVWDKRFDPKMPQLDDAYGSQFELVWSRQGHRREILRILWSGHFGLQGEDTRARVHPTQKPTELYRQLMATLKASVVLDPYGGSGSTLIAAEQTGITAHLIEFDPVYADITITRWQELTGELATR